MKIPTPVPVVRTRILLGKRSLHFGDGVNNVQPNTNFSLMKNIWEYTDIAVVGDYR